MVFTDLLFLFGFLPLNIILYRIIPTQKIKNIVLVILSFLFYAWGNPISLILLLLSILWNYFTALELQNESIEKQLLLIYVC